MGLSLNWQKIILGSVFGDTELRAGSGPDIAPGGSGSLFIGLSTSTPSEVNGYNFTEPSGNAYARVQISNTTAAGTGSDTQAWAAPTGTSAGEVSNRIAIQFPTANGGQWGTITHFGIFSDSTSAITTNLIGWAALSSSKVIGDGDTASFDVGQLKIAFS